MHFLSLLPLVLQAALPQQESPAVSPTERTTNTTIISEECIFEQLNARFDFRWRLRGNDTPRTWDSDLWVSADLETNNGLTGTDYQGFRIDGTLLLDLDGNAAPSDNLFGLDDAHKTSAQVFLYEAWAQFGDNIKEGITRVGRQELHRTDALWLDGLRYDFQTKRGLDALIFAGRPAHFYEHDSSNDRLYGAGLRWRPLSNLRFSLDELRIEDSFRFQDTDQSREAWLTVLTAYYQPSPFAMFRGTGSWVGSTDRRQSIYGQWSAPDGSWSANARFTKQRDYAELLPADASEFSNLFGTISPYSDAMFVMRSELDGGWFGEFGYQERRLDSNIADSNFNHSFRRAWAGLDTKEFYETGAEAGLHVDAWESDDYDTTAGGGFMRWGLDNEKWLELASDYAPYRLDFLQGREFLDSQRYTVRMGIPTGDGSELRFRLSHDRSQDGLTYLADVSWRVQL